MFKLLCNFLAYLMIVFAFVMFFGCAASQSTQYSHGRHIGSDVLKGFVAGTKGMLEGRAETRKKRQQQNAIISNSIKQLGSPDTVMPYNEYIVYYWSKISIGMVIQHLGIPDAVSSDPDVSLYRWGSYIFSDKRGFYGVICLQKIE